MNAAVRILLLSAYDNGGVLPVPGYVAAGLHGEDMDELQRQGWFDKDDTLTEAGAAVAAGLNWEDKQ